MRGGYVYLIGVNGDNGMYKIGVTCAKDLNQRIKQLQTGNGNELILVNSFKSSKPYKMETMLHNRFQEQREDGEWFLLSREQVDGFTTLCEQYQSIIDSLENNPFF